MAEKINDEIDSKELDLEQLERVSGGLVVDCGAYRNCRVVNDKTGEILDTEWFKPGNAQELASQIGVGTEVISMDEYKKRFGRALDLSIRVKAPCDTSQMC